MGTKKWIAMYNIKLKKKKHLTVMFKALLGISLVLSHSISMKTYTHVYHSKGHYLYTTLYAFPD